MIGLALKPVADKFHQLGKHNQKTHGHGGGSIADVGDKVSSKDGKVSGALATEYMSFKNTSTGAQEDWLKLETTGKKKWFQDTELVVDVKGPQGMARTTWHAVYGGNQLEVNQVIKTPNGVGAFQKKMVDKDGTWIYANVPGSKKKWYLAHEVEAGVIDGKGAQYKAPTGSPSTPASKSIPKASSTPVVQTPGSTASPSVGNPWTVPSGSTGKVAEIQGNWVKIEGAGAKKWYKLDELVSAPAPQSTSPFKHPKTIVGLHPADGKYLAQVWTAPSWNTYINGWTSAITAGERAAVTSYTGSAYSTINTTLRHGDYKSSTKALTVNRIDSALAKAKIPEHVTVYRGTSGQMYKNLKPGDIVEDKGYVSTSTSKNGAFSGHLMAIRVPAGSTAAFVKPISSHPGENELLLPRGSRFKVVSVTDKPNGYGEKAFELELVP